MMEQTTTDFAAVVTDIATWLEQHRAAAVADRFIVGLSGGIDSAVVCGLCALAAGAGRVTGVIMPSDSNADDARDAAAVAETFQVETITIDLTAVTGGLLTAIRTGINTAAVSDGNGPRAQLAEANVRPRLRMTTLYYLANLMNGIVVGTGNKSEAMIGYFTKYGDGGVDLLPIVDLYKHEVRALARALGAPEGIITKPPSAGLWPGQTDEAEIGLEYDDLDAALMAIASGETGNLSPAVHDRVRGLIDGSDHKRQPIPAYRRDER